MSPITKTARTGTLLFAFIFSFQFAFAGSAPPVNDNCTGAIGLTLDITKTGGTVKQANPSAGVPIGTCTGNPDDDVWYTFTLSSTTSITITLSNIGTSLLASGAIVQLLSGTCPSGLSSLACGTTEISYSNLASGIYFVRVFSIGTTLTNNADFDITVTGPPVNDICSGAPTLTSATSCFNTLGTIVNASASTGLPAGCESVGTHNDVWYKFVAGGTTHTVTLSGPGSNFTNPEIQLYSGACGSFTSIACGTTSVTSSALTNGITYYVRVSNIGIVPGNNGDFNICLTHPPPPPSNDDCGGATTLTSAASCSNIAGTLEFSTATVGLPAGCEAGGTHYDVWYKFVASNTTHIVTISGQGSNFTNPEIQLYSGACGSFTSIACGTTSVTSSALTNGITYYVRVSNIGSSPTINGDFNICVTHPPPPPSNDDCGGATTLNSATSCTNVAGTIEYSTATTGVPAGCIAGTHYDVWYKFVASNSTHTVTVSGRGSNFTNPEIQLYSGTCGSLVSITCGTTTLTSSALNNGATYYVRVSNIGSSLTVNGDFNICVTQPIPPVTVKGGRMNEVYKQTILSGPGALLYPWEVTYGPDNNLWITESRGYKVYKMDPNTGAKIAVLDLNSASTDLSAWGADSLRAVNLTSTNNWNASANNWPQGGLAGLAIHPNFMDGSGLYDFVYISYVHRYLSTASSSGGIFFRNKIVRFTYNSVTEKLGSPIVVCDTIPGGQDHNSQRMIIAPVTPGGPSYLFYAAGDMGSGQYANRLRAQNAQNPASYEGKILRFNLEPDGGAGAEAWIPDDNPYSATSAVWSIGIRNNQGFAYNPVTNKLYGASHGPYSDDEINIIEPAKNYGHPLVIGFASDGNANNTSAGAPLSDASGVSSCPIITSESANATTIGSSYKDPLFSSYPNSVAFPSIYNLWSNTTGANAQWPTEAWSGLDIYTNTLIPGWKNSLVAASLKWGRLVKLKLNSAGTATMPNNSVSDTITYFNSQNRFRDMAFSPDGKDIFVIMDNNSATSGPGAANPVVPQCAGCVQKYTFLGYYDVSGKSSIPTSIDVTDAAVNTCNTGTTITIDNSNNNLWVPITGPDGNIMAEIYANGNNLGTVTSTFYKNSGSIRVANSTHYLDRNMTITPQTQPTSTVKIRLYLSKAELDALIADGASNVSAISNLKVYKNNDPCSGAISAPPTAIVPTYAEAHGANGYMLQADITSFSSFYFAAANSFTLFTLPLDLLSFTGQLQNNNSVLLNWKTENEFNTSHFAVERSADGIRFNGIGNVTANGRNNTGGSFSYAFTDNDAINQSSQRLYYRLKMVDIDGNFKYSNIISVSFPLITGKLSIAPNPVLSEMNVTIASEADGKVQWKLTDNVGRVIQKGSEYVRKGPGNHFTINMHRLSAGTYNLNVTGAGIDQNEKIQKL